MSLYGFYLVVIYCDTLYLIIQYVKGKPIEKIVSPITWLIADNKLMKILLHYEYNKATLFYNCRSSIFAFVISCLWPLLLIPSKYINVVGILCMISVYIIALIVLIIKAMTAIREKNIEKRKKRRTHD